MKPNFRSAGSFLAMFMVAAALSGCAVSQQEEHRRHHPEAPSAASPAGMGQGATTGQMGMMGSGAAGQMGMMDKKLMCEMHDKMMTAKTPAERTAMMDDRMKNMSQDERQKNMEMMKQQCK